jgi:hypothetical protein
MGDDKGNNEDKTIMMTQGNRVTMRGAKVDRPWFLGAFFGPCKKYGSIIGLVSLHDYNL